MLAKVWKKVLLAICIIACIFNIMSKLVNRHSLKENLESANDGVTVFNFFQKDEVVETESAPIIEGVMNPEPEVTNTDNTTVVVEGTSNEITDTENSSETTEEQNSVVEEITKEEKKNNGTFKFSDFTILF